MNEASKPSLVKSFTRAQVASVAATAVDFGLLFFLTEFLHVWYVISVAVGAAAGAVTNFLINRHWSFEATHGHWKGQAVRYAVVSAGSMLLNTGGTWAVTEWGHIPYGFSVVAVSIAVGFAYNYPLQRKFVFK
jgi:putative flippase GtrA